MADSFKVTADFSQVYAKKEWLRAYVGKMVMKSINLTSVALQKHIKQDLFKPYPDGTTDSSLSTRSGYLKKSVTTIPAVMDTDGESARGGIAVGSVYGKVHFGKKGDSFRIVGKPWLKIPLPNVLNGRGLVKDHEKSFWLPSKKNPAELVMYGKLMGMRTSKGVRTKRGIGDDMPLFVLKHEVRIPVRISSEDLRDYAKPVLGKLMADIKAGIEGSTSGGLSGITD